MSDLIITCDIGINHSGSLENAKRLIDMAKSCGADAVKFQKRTIDIVYNQKFLNSYRESPWGTTQREQKEALEFSKEDYDEIDRYCKEKKIYWYASAWDLKSQEFLRRYRLIFNKIASPMLTNKSLLEMVASEHKHTYISTGMSTITDISNAVEIFKKHKTSFTLMHCTSEYPSSDEHLNLKMIPALKKRFGCSVGFSSHSSGILAPPLAVAIGAEAIEVHITLSRASYGTDQPASLERQGLARTIRDCKLIKEIMGDGKKVVYREEQKNAKKLRYWEDGALCKTA
jgi:N-acetylneuraminate synthase